MALRIRVPVSVQRVAHDALVLHKSGEAKLEGVVGVAFAEQAASGEVDFDSLSRAYRFFSTNRLPYLHEVRHLRTERDSAVVRSWLLHGAEAGDRWVAEEYAKAVERGDVSEDPIADLFELAPDEVADRFQAGAWRYEYGLNPTSAARFVEEYMRCTGNPLELPRVFGTAAPAVGQAIYRRFHSPDPLRTAIIAAGLSEEMKQAAQADVLEMSSDYTELEESLSKQVFTTMTAQQAGKLVWAPFIAYLIMAVEDKAALKDYNATSAKPPAFVTTPKAYTAYNDIINTLVTYFNPAGARYQDPDGTEWDSADTEIYDIVVAAYKGQVLTNSKVLTALKLVKGWLTTNKQAGPLFQQLVTAWQAEDYKFIFNHIPLDSDIRASFATFAGIPLDGAEEPKVATSADKAPRVDAPSLPANTPPEAAPQGATDGLGKDALLAALQGWVGNNYAVGSELVSAPVVKLDGLFGKHPSKVGLNYAVEVVDAPVTLLMAVAATVKDAAEPTVNHPVTLIVGASGGQYFVRSLKWWKDRLANGSATLQGDAPPVSKDITGKAPKVVSKAPDPPPIPVDSLSNIPAGPVRDTLVEAFGKAGAAKLLPIAVSGLDFAYALKNKYAVSIAEGAVLANVFGQEPVLFEVVSAYEVKGGAALKFEYDDGEQGSTTGPIVVLKDDAGVLTWEDAENVHGAVQAGKVQPVEAVLGEHSVLHDRALSAEKWAQILAYGDHYNSDWLQIDLAATEFFEAAVDKAFTSSIGQFSEWEVKSNIVGAAAGKRKLLAAIQSKDGTEEAVVWGCADKTKIDVWPMSLAVSRLKAGTMYPAGEAKAVEAEWVPKFTQGQLLHVPSHLLKIKTTAPIWAVVETVAYGQYYLNAFVMDEGTTPPLILVDGKTLDAADGVEPLPGKGDSNVAMFDTATSLMLWPSYWKIVVGAAAGMLGAVPVGSKVVQQGVAQWYAGAVQTDDGIVWAIAATSHAHHSGISYWRFALQIPSAFEALASTYAPPSIKPEPGTDVADLELTAEGFPKLNYKLSKVAKKIAEKSGIVFTPSPSNPPVLVGAYLQDATLLKWRVVGWDKGMIILALASDTEDAPSGYSSSLSPHLLVNYKPYYKNQTEYDKQSGSLTFGKKGNNVASVTTPKAKLTIPSAMDKYLLPTPVNQPVFKSLPKGKHVAAGVVMVLPGGTSFFYGTGDTADVVKPPEPVVVLVNPTNSFGGYELTFPKGTVEKGEGLALAAVREVWEETGLSCQPVAYLGDFESGGSVTRMFIGYVQGGNPVKAGPESEGVRFQPVSIWNDAYKNAEWYKSMRERDRKIMDAAATWLLTKGAPDATALAMNKASADVQVTGESVTAVADTSKSKPTTTPLPAVTMNPIWFEIVKDAAFPVTLAMMEKLKQAWADAGLGEATYYVLFDTVQISTLGGKPMVTGVPACATDANDVRHNLVGGVRLSNANGESATFIVGVTVDGAFALPDSVAKTLRVYLPAKQLPKYPLPASVGVQAWLTIIAQHGMVAPYKMTDLKAMAKAAGIPTSNITTNNAKYVAMLMTQQFITGSMADAIDQSLQDKATAKKALHVDTEADKTVETVDSLSTPKPVTVMPPPMVTIDHPIDSVGYHTLLEKPDASQFKETGKSASGGSKPNKILESAGVKFLFKTGKASESKEENDGRAYTDRAAYLLADYVKGNNIPVGVMEFDGKVGSVQPFDATAKTPPDNPIDLEVEDQIELMQQHVVDMFTGDHDGHVGNWIISGGKLRAIDRGQAFKFYFKDQKVSLDPSWSPAGNFGEGYAKILLLTYGAGKYDISDDVFKAMRRTIDKIQGLLTSTLEEILDPVFKARGTTKAQQAKVLGRLVETRDDYLDAWTKVLTKLRPTFEWPATGAISPVKDVEFKASPEDLGLKSQHAKVFVDAAKAGWAGKTLQIDRDAVENQNMLVKAVDLELPGMKASVPGTLVYFRLRGEGALAAAKSLMDKAEITVKSTDPASLTSPRLKADVFFSDILAAVKTINHHLNENPDLKPNPTTVQKALAHEAPLAELVKKTAKAKKGDKWEATKEPAVSVYQMATLYSGYIEAIKTFMADVTQFKGQKISTVTEYVYVKSQEEKEAEKVEHQKSGLANIKVELRQHGATFPATTATPAKAGKEARIKVTHLGDIAAASHSTPQPQFVIRDLSSDLNIFYMPPASAASFVGKAGMRGHQGVVWSVIPGDPTPANMARMMKLFQDLTTIPMSPASETDRQIRYWMNQAVLVQGGGKIEPKDDSGLADPALMDLMAQYRSGLNDVAVIEALQAYVAGKMGKPVNAVVKMAAPEIEGVYDSRGVGFNRVLKLGWTRQRLQETFHGLYVAHCTLSKGLDSFFQLAANNGALLSNNMKPYTGVKFGSGGASSDSDLSYGGSQGLFMGLRSLKQKQSNVLFFDISLLARADVYMVGTGDTFGKVFETRYTDPERIKSAGGASAPTSHLGASSPYQINVRHDIDLRQYLKRARFGSKQAAESTVALCKSLGWTTFGPDNESVEDVMLSLSSGS